MLQYYMLRGIARILFKMTGLDEKLYLKPINQVHYQAWTKKWIIDPWTYIITPIPKEDEINIFEIIDSIEEFN